MDIAITILSILHVFVALLLVLIVLWQRPRQEGLGTSFGGGMSEQMFGAQTTNVLQKGTVWLSIIFFLNTMVIASLMAQRTKANKDSNLLKEKSAVTAPAVPAAPEAKPAAPATPAAPEAATPAPTAPAPTTETLAPAAPAAETAPAPAAPAAPTPAAPEAAAPAPATPAPAPAATPSQP